MGDVILTTPLIRCLKARFPDSEIDFLVKKEFSGVLSENPYLSNIILFDKSFGKDEILRVRALIKNGNYSHIIDIQNNIRSVLLRAFSGASVSSFSKRILARYFLIKFKKNFYKEVKPVYLRYFEAVSKLGVSYDGQGTELFFQESDKELMEADLAKNGLNTTNQLLIVAPGAQWANKRWLPSGFAQSADALSLRYNYTVVLLGGKGDVEICTEVQKLMKSPSIMFAGKSSLMQSAALLSRAALVLTNDTGILHMAQAVKTPVVAVFGPTTKELGFCPLPYRSKIAEADLECRPCTQKGLNGCPKTHFNCMKNVYPEKVISLAHELIQTETSMK